MILRFNSQPSHQRMLCSCLIGQQNATDVGKIKHGLGRLSQSFKGKLSVSLLLRRG